MKAILSGMVPSEGRKRWPLYGPEALSNLSNSILVTTLSKTPYPNSGFFAALKTSYPGERMTVPTSMVSVLSRSP
jgi:hypothetical protein